MFASTQKVVLHIAASRFREMNQARKYILLLILATITSSVFAEDSPTTRETWRSRFIIEAPLEWKRCAEAMSQCEVRQSTKYETFLKDGAATPEPASTLISTAKVIFDYGLGGTRCDIYADGADTVGNAQSIIGDVVSNKKYEFQLGRTNAQNFHIEKYNPGSEDQTPVAWENKLQTEFWALLSGNVDKYPLSNFISGVGGKLTSVEPIEVDGKQMVRLSIDRLLFNSQKPYPATAIVDPNFHWAVRSFRQQLKARVETGTVTYHEELSSAAFPKKYIEERYNLLGQLTGRDTYAFEAPQPSHAKAEDFTLEAFGLTEPKDQSAITPQASDPYKRVPSTAPMISGATASSFYQIKLIILVAVLGIVFYGIYILNRKKASSRKSG